MTSISNFLNKHSRANLPGVFETQTFQVCPTEPIICVKEDLLRKSPNSLTRTFLNADIHFNWNFSRGGFAILNQELNSLDLTLQNEIKDFT